VIVLCPPVQGVVGEVLLASTYAAHDPADNGVTTTRAIQTHT